MGETERRLWQQRRAVLADLIQGPSAKIGRIHALRAAERLLAAGVVSLAQEPRP